MTKERISLTLNEHVVDRVDVEASSKDLNRSEMVEKILQEYLEEVEINTAVVFCGGRDGKALREWEGKPVLKRVLERLEEEVFKAVLLAGENSDEVRRLVENSDFNLDIEIVADSASGTARALKEAERHVEGVFLAVNGHVVSDVDVEEMLDVHREEGRVATMALTTVEAPSDYGVALLKGREITGFEEKPSSGEEPSRLINAGTYMLEEEIFQHLEKNSIEEVFENLASESQLTGYIYGGGWIDFKQD